MLQLQLKKLISYCDILVSWLLKKLYMELSHNLRGQKGKYYDASYGAGTIH